MCQPTMSGSRCRRPWQEVARATKGWKDEDEVLSNHTSVFKAQNLHTTIVEASGYMRGALIGNLPSMQLRLGLSGTSYLLISFALRSLYQSV
jgi:hypothetical protein